MNAKKKRMMYSGSFGRYIETPERRDIEGTHFEEINGIRYDDFRAAGKPHSKRPVLDGVPERVTPPRVLAENMMHIP